MAFKVLQRAFQMAFKVPHKASKPLSFDFSLSLSLFLSLPSSCSLSVFSSCSGQLLLRPFLTRLEVLRPAKPGALKGLRMAFELPSKCLRSIPQGLQPLSLSVFIFLSLSLSLQVFLASLQIALPVPRADRFPKKIQI